jgi:hypothetical protein
MFRTDPCRTLRHGRGLTIVALLLAALACGLAVQAWRPARAHAEIARCIDGDACDTGSDDGGGGGGGGGGGDWNGGDPNPAGDDPGAPDPGSGGTRGSGTSSPGPADDPDPSTGLGPNSGTDSGPSDARDGQPYPAPSPDAPDPTTIEDPDPIWLDHLPEELDDDSWNPPPPPPLLPPGTPCEDEFIAVAAAKLRSVAEDLARRELEACLKANGIPITTARTDPSPAPGVTALVASARRSAAWATKVPPRPAKPAKRPRRPAPRRRPPHPKHA